MSNHQVANFPLVSVIIPAYNAENFLEKTLDSALSQTYKNFEIIIVDDGSQNRTPQIAESFARQDTRITFLRQSNHGVATARNLGIQKSQGEYIAPLDADDIWYPQKLEKQVQCFLESDPSVGLVYVWPVNINEEGLPTGISNNHTLEGDVFLPLVYTNIISCASTPLIRRSCFERVGYYNCRLKELNAQGCEDWDLYVRLAEHYQFRVVPEILLGYRRVISSMSSNYNSMVKSRFILMNELQLRYSEIPCYLFMWSFSNYYRYLAQQSRRSGNHKSTLIWLYKALKTDYANYLDYNLYKLLFTSFLKLITQPIMSLVWSDHRAWLKFKRKFKLQQPKTLEEIKRTIDPSKFNRWNLYHRVRRQRWLKISSLPKIIDSHETCTYTSSTQ